MEGSQRAWPDRLLHAFVLLLALSACEGARKPAKKLQRTVFPIEGPENLMNMVGGLMESQHNFQAAGMHEKDPIAEILVQLTAPLLAAQKGFAEVQNFLADPLNVENSPLVKDLQASLEPNEAFFKNFQTIMQSGNPYDTFLKSAQDTWEPALEEFVQKDASHKDEHELAAAFGLTDLFEEPKKDVTSMSIVNIKTPVKDKITNKVFDKLDELQAKKYYNFNFTEPYVPSKKAAKFWNKTDMFVNKLASKLHKPKHLPALKKKKTDPLEAKWTKFWGKKKWADMKEKAEKFTLKGADLKPAQKKPITLDGKLGEKLVYKDTKELAYIKKLKPPQSPDYLEPLMDALLDDKPGRLIKPVFDALPRFRDPFFKRVAGWNTGTRAGGLGANARAINYGPCFVSESWNAVSVQPVMFNLSPQLVSVSAQGVNIAPQLINIGPTLINIAPKGLDASPKGIDVNPRIIQVSPNVAWTGVNVPDVLGKPPRKRPSTPISENYENGKGHGKGPP